jgi:hypothetical protein
MGLTQQQKTMKQSCIHLPRRRHSCLTHHQRQQGIQLMLVR